MKRKGLIFLLLLFWGMTVIAETSLIIQPLIGNEQANALSAIGYVKVTQDTMFTYSHSNESLGKNAIRDIRTIRYGEPSEATSVDDVNASICYIYPNPTQDMLIIDYLDAEKAYIFDLNGRLLRTIALHGEKATINVTAFPQGEYLLLLNTQTIKFIKR